MDKLHQKKIKMYRKRNNKYTSFGIVNSKKIKIFFFN
jgi:hypothetical protein